MVVEQPVAAAANPCHNGVRKKDYNNRGEKNDAGYCLAVIVDCMKVYTLTLNHVSSTSGSPIRNRVIRKWSKSTIVNPLSGIAILSSDIFPMVEASRGLSAFENPSSFPASLQQENPTKAVQSPSPPTPTPNNPTQDSFADGTRHRRYTP
ncbi:hypothetical protein V6N12_042661 [Hibiscus sabdariffa]|uniref:Uncharacterized protein n=1 Tax=Hibiscus sabdariffa TaxID=183260 RepID=A0ABR2AKZ9_9ROSI